MSRRIRLVSINNPKRGNAAIRYAQYKDGMTSDQYVRACEGLRVPNHALFDITWDFDHGFIELFD